MKTTTAIKNCAQCGWPRYRNGVGTHVGIGSMDCPEQDSGTPQRKRQRQKLTRRWA